MVQVSDSLLWELTRKNTSFMKKTNGRTKRSGTIKFSCEKGNVKSLSQFKYSGLANSKVVDVVCTEENRAQLVTKTASKAAVEPKGSFRSININKDFRRSEKVICSQALDNYYRPDLKADVLAKYYKVYQANRRAKGIKKIVPVKKGRSKSNK
jgi:large subunit ribosomal protein L28e